MNGISVVISTMDRAEALARCLDALGAGSLLPAEVVIVDQSRGSATRDLVHAREGGPLALVYVPQEPRGLGASQNEGVRRARNPLVAITDDDCIVAADWLGSIQALLTARGGPDVIAGRVLPLPESGDRTYPVASRTSTIVREFHGRGMPWEVGSGNNFAFRREWYLRIGGCDERLGPGSPAQGGVDMDLFYRLLRAGARIRYDPAVIVHHERDTWEGRRRRRPMYARGMGASCAFRLREGDAGALRILLGWTGLRLGLMAKAARRRSARGVYEELLMLGGTVAGLAHGVVRGGSWPPAD